MHLHHLISILSLLLSLAQAAPHQPRACKGHASNFTRSSNKPQGFITKEGVSATAAMGETASPTISRSITSSSVAPSGAILVGIDTTSSPTSFETTSIAAPSVTTSSTSSAVTSASPATTTPSTGSGTGLVGLGWNHDSGRTIAPFVNAPGSKLSWFYDWGLSPIAGNDFDGLEFVPMVWGAGSVAGVPTAEKQWTGVRTVLSFNEPNLAGQALMSAGDGAKNHIAWVNSLTGTYQIGAPAVARGGKQWFQDWVTQCAGQCKYDFVPIHFYGTNADDFVAYLKDFHTTFNKPLWVTEFGCHDYSTGQICTADEVKSFMKTAMSFMRSVDYVERWAWFGAFPNMAAGGDANGIMNTDSTPNAIGSLFVTL